MDEYKRALAGSICDLKRIQTSHISPETEIEVSPEQITPTLRAYLRGDLSATELKEWAGFVLACEAFVCPNWDNDILADQYEPMWEILQQLSTPELDGEITPDSVAGHLATLRDIQRTVGK